MDNQHLTNTMQEEINKISTSVLRGIENGALHFITVQREGNEMIDATLLNSGLLHGGIVVENINDHNLVDGQFAMNIQDSYTNDIHINVESNEQDRKIAAAIYQLVNRQNDTQVIVSNKNLPPLTPISQLKRRKKTSKISENLIKHNDDYYFPSNFAIESQQEQTVAEENVSKSKIKKALPHKKRLSKKVSKKQEEPKITYEQADQSIIEETRFDAMFTCQLCNLQIKDQLEFFAHLKDHYEPLKKEGEEFYECNEQDKQEHIEIASENNSPEYIKEELPEDLNEFSETEDMLDGIEGVVEKVQKESDDDHIDDEEWYEELGSSISFKSSDIDSSVLTPQESLEFLANEESLSIAVSPAKSIDKEIVLPKKNKRGRKSKNIKILEDDSDESVFKKGYWSKCNKCDKIFNSKNAYQYHQLSHSGIRPHQCENCGKGFFTASALKVHTRLHSGVKPYQCKYCDRAFRQWGDMKYHITSIHSDEKKFQCEFCGKDFARRYSLVIHRRIHTGERNYRCEYCEKSFRASSYLLNHRRIHTGEKPHECPICTKKFRVRSDMKRHIVTHERDKTNRRNSKQNKDNTINVSKQKKMTAEQVTEHCLTHDPRSTSTSKQETVFSTKQESDVQHEPLSVHKQTEENSTQLNIQQENPNAVVYSDAHIEIFRRYNEAMANEITPNKSYKVEDINMEKKIKASLENNIGEMSINYTQQIAVPKKKSKLIIKVEGNDPESEGLQSNGQHVYMWNYLKDENQY